MAVINTIAGFADEMTAWRQHLHQHPELGTACHDTADFVVQRLRSFGITEIHRGFATTGLVALIDGHGPGPTIGLRADMDGLPIEETSGVEWASCRPGKMHACGHDGHTTMLLGAAKYLVETRNFSGRVALIFQPAEETGGGAEIMVEQGILEQFEIAEVYALHNAPAPEVGRFYTTGGPIMAAVDTFDIHITGQGGHGAYPQVTRDPVIAAASMVMALQSLVSRNHFACDDLVVSVTQIHTGTTDNVIPETAYINGTVRTFDTAVQAMVMARMPQIVAGQAASFGVAAELIYTQGYPATVNDFEKTKFAAAVAREVVGDDNVDASASREMGAEDFSYMLEKRPGCYLFLTQGASAGLHHSAYDFNDDVAPIGASFFARIVERAQPLK